MGFVRATDAGPVQEKSVAAREGYPLPHGRGLYPDRGVQGFVLHESTLVRPQKNPRGGELTPPEHATTRRLSSLSLRLAHAMGGVKRDRLVPDKRRLFTAGSRDPLMDTCGGLHTFRLQYRPWHYAS